LDLLSLIPYDVSQFFFFDGEKIQDFVRDEDAEFARSLEQVLGISDYRRLYDDLRKVRSDLVAEYNKDANVQVQIKEVEAKIAEANRSVGLTEENISKLREEIRDLQAQIEGIDTETRRITRVKAETLDEYRNQRDGLREEKGALEQQIFETVKDDLPLVMTAPLCQELLQQLGRELELERHLAAQRAIEPKINQITNKLFYEGLESVPMLAPKQKEFYVRKLRDVLEKTLAERPTNLESAKLIHNLAPNDVQQIRRRIEDSSESIQQLSRYLQRLQEIEPILERIERTERQANADSEAERLYRERGDLEGQIRSKQEEILRLQAEIDKNKDAIQSLNAQHTRLEERAQATAKRQKQIEYCRKLCDVIDDFSHEFRKQRAERLEDYTLAMWQKLARKQDLIRRIEVNPNKQFSIDLYDTEDRLIDKTKLSAGEKELLAISLVSALSQIADRSLPIVIDTPLGRLDTEHRAHIARYYFPNTSHQVILLSTDTEIVDNELTAIKPYISKYYTIVYNEPQQISTVEPDKYFE
jgi:DNA sulfur modification protein DndD